MDGVIWLITHKIPLLLALLLFVPPKVSAIKTARYWSVVQICVTELGMKYLCSFTSQSSEINLFRGKIITTSVWSRATDLRF